MEPAVTRRDRRTSPCQLYAGMTGTDQRQVAEVKSRAVHWPV